MKRPPSAARPRASAALLLSGIALLAVACSSPEAAEISPTPEPTVRPTVAATSTPTPTPTPTPEITPTPEPGIGTPVNVGDEQYVTVTGFDRWPGTETQQPAAGNVFVSVEIRIEAITTTSFTSEDFTVEDVEGNSYSEQRGRAPHLSSLDGMEPGHFYVGLVTFEVPAAAADELILVYTPNFLDTTFEIELH